MATLSQPTLLPDAPLPGLNTTLGAVMIGAFICAVNPWTYRLMTRTCIGSTALSASKPLCCVRFLAKTTSMQNTPCGFFGELKSLAACDARDTPFFDTVTSRAVNTAHLAFSIHPCYWYMVTNYGRPATIDRIPCLLTLRALTTKFGVFLTGINDVLVRRLVLQISTEYNHSSHSMRLAGSFIGSGSPLWFVPSLPHCMRRDRLRVYHRYRVRTFSVFRQDEWILDTDMSLVFVSDVVLALFLCFYLAGSRSSVLSRRWVWPYPRDFSRVFARV
ncbi:uncharacterized protein PHACADRAFT_183383 [Phanerochaete carnosa HHB-10118-sp]|uniref:Uncharacterized protein n=1 Tax=Phanerochaete carnosa (strain HHB-10118-sp) TaxID=650164 RepID=K5X215_PHACS|nr:uncharacterized protein PHACADRAFT_183383 [Phanerochaete carnosa HHB-10118-sp]EKM56797.1 hypothetical protein PHACADRAFT_183383 [Phanerochaete carnosa HHB-10118-sp]